MSGADQPARRIPRLRHAFSVPKREGQRNEDRWLASDCGSICAISDGASVSYDSGPWAAILVRRFVESPRISKSWIEAGVKEYIANYDRDAMPWMHQASFDRGSYATLLGVTFSSDARFLKVCAVGDSLLALADNAKLVRTYPYVAAAEFDRSPVLLSTDPLANRSIEDAFWDQPFYEVDLAPYPEPSVLLMSDALGRWLLEQCERLSLLLDTRDEPSFRRLVNEERSASRLITDDTTLLVLA